MSKLPSKRAALSLAGLLLLLFMSVVANRPPEATDVAHRPPATRPAGVGRAKAESDTTRQDQPNSLPLSTTPPSSPRRPAKTKAERVEQIVDDYDQLAVAVLGGLGAEDGASTGPSNTLLRQLALLEHEKRKDLAAVLTPRELEDMEFKETKAGRVVTRLFEGTHATEEQRRKVFRLQRALELQFSQDVAPSPLTNLERAHARLQTEQQIRAVLGEELFHVWLAGTDALQATAATIAKEHGVSPRIADELRKARDDYSLRLLTLQATPDLAPELRSAAKQLLVEESRSRALAILGPALYQTARDDLVNWLPRE